MSVQLEVPFHDIDILGIAWHGHYYKYFELARTALYRSRNLDIANVRKLGYIFPVIESQCRYVQPLGYGQRTVVEAVFSEWQSYIKISYVIRDEIGGDRFAYGYTKQAVCKVEGNLLLNVPDEVVDAISG
ncbi:MAG: acyl-CoA thioesterase [Candidatus Thiodiazotropha sp.]